MPFVYTADVAVRQHEVDRSGHVHPAVYLRYLTQAAVEASTAAGFDAAWYAAAGGLWIVRRSTLEVHRPVRTGERVAIRTWVEDFRRVRSERRYEVRVGESVRAEARTDWVYVDAASGRPRRVPPELMSKFDAASPAARERADWDAPPPPDTVARTQHRVRVHELDGLGHMNNAAYLDVLMQAVLDTLEGAGWPLDRLADGGMPAVARTDLEYLESAHYGERLEIATWFTPAPGALDAHQRMTREGEDRTLVQATTRWRWPAAPRAADPDLPAGLLAAIGPLLAA